LLSRVIDVVEPALGGVIRGVICRSSAVSSASLERRLSDLDRSTAIGLGRFGAAFGGKGQRGMLPRSLGLLAPFRSDR
jgi:hypothetical protein